MNAEVAKTLSRIGAQVDRLGDVYSKGFADARAAGIAILAGCNRFQAEQQRTLIALEGMNK